MIPIVVSIVLNVMAQRRYKKRQGIKIVEVGFVDEALVLKDQVAVLCDVRAMHVIMVLNRPFVLVVDLGEEL
jgi:hypothetical protein